LSQIGAPVGNKNATKNRLWAETLNRALLAEDGKKLRELADKLINRALEGDVTALKEIGDRVDGRPMQAHELSGPDGGEIPHKVEVILVRPSGS
jgi:hypothetical protein